MNISTLAQPDMSPLRSRLSRLARLESADLDALRVAERDEHRSPARREFIAEGSQLRSARAVLSGWAFRQRILIDGRRQIIDFLLPGDLIGVSQRSNPVSPTSIVAITEVVTCPVPTGGEALADAFAHSASLTEYYLLAQVTRLGRLSAQERLAEWFLETYDRLALAGLASGDQFAMPLSQELLGDALGLTSVHVNRMLQALLREGLISRKGRMVSLRARDRLENLVQYKRPRIGASCARSLS